MFARQTNMNTLYVRTTRGTLSLPPSLPTGHTPKIISSLKDGIVQDKSCRCWRTCLLCAYHPKKKLPPPRTSPKNYCRRAHRQNLPPQKLLQYYGGYVKLCIVMYVLRTTIRLKKNDWEERNQTNLTQKLKYLVKLQNQRGKQD